MSDCSCFFNFFYNEFNSCVGLLNLKLSISAIPMDDWERYTRVLDINLELVNDGIQFNFKMKRSLALF